MTALPQPAAPAAAGASRPVRDRIRGVDAARALAILGMVTVHFGPIQPDTSDLLGRVYRFSYGRASVLFVLLAGVGISLLLAARPVGESWTRIAWRAIVFYPLGVVLQPLDHGVAVILQFYALYYLVGGLAALLPTRWLALLTAAWTIAGPLLFLALQDPELAGRGTATAISDPPTVVSDLLLTGYYPVITWTPPLLVGLLVGRTDLRDTATDVVLAVGGFVVALATYGGSALARSAAAPDVAGSSYLLAEGHTGAPLNVVGATAVAVAVLGTCLLLARALPRVSWPLVAVGQLALTVYVGHLLVLAWQPDWLIARDAVDVAALRVLRFFVVVAVTCVAWRVVFPRGPLEALLALPFRRRPSGPPAPPPAAQVEARQRSDGGWHDRPQHTWRAPSP
ncbi:DUF418 domain-containing protein [Euzebya sp.]|uniref:DUF418 domain-containing protein n=1 Tax=Euzebya sp. TaxID=1971409 RepID=UPI0035122D0C